MPGEDRGRGTWAAWVNQQPYSAWDTRKNTGDALGYISGSPDGNIIRLGEATYIECKGGYGKLDLGKPENKEDGTGWSLAQRSWFLNMCVRTRTSYYILAWVYEELTVPARHKSSLEHLFLVPPRIWINTEKLLNELAPGLRTIALYSRYSGRNIIKENDFCIDKLWGSYRITDDKGKIDPTLGVLPNIFEPDAEFSLDDTANNLRDLAWFTKPESQARLFHTQLEVKNAQE